MRVSGFAVIALFVVAFFSSALPAAAYVDPGTGGMLLQLVTGGLAGLGVLARLYWQKLRGRRPDAPQASAADDLSGTRPE